MTKVRVIKQQPVSVGVKSEIVYGNAPPEPGENGATFIPEVSADGVISWTNDRGLPNPNPVNIKGDKGDKGEDGIQGPQGEQGERGEQGLKGDKGDTGAAGSNGKDGADGKDGYTPIKGVDYFDGKDGMNGKDGADGKNGVDGYTPVKGVDYFTEADKTEMVSAVISALPIYGGEVVSV